jgi:D-sedoheptulose 7-phosphate isomerase
MLFERLEKFNQIIKKCESTTSINDRMEIDGAFSLAKEYLETTKKLDGVVYIIGNNQAASKISTELIKNLNISSSSLLDLNLLMSFTCEYGYENSYTKPLNVLLRENDLLIAMSNSGQSPNVLNATYFARRKNIKIITMSGGTYYNQLRQIGDLNFWFNSTDYILIEMSYSFILNTIISEYQRIGQKESCYKISNT